jgi:hypothetical protein
MEARDMKPHDISALDHDQDGSFDTALSEHFRRQAETDDDGFSQRVMAALPARAARPHVRWADWAQRAQWAAISGAACVFAALTSSGDGRLDISQTAAAYSLIGLLIFWSIPSRWSRG